MAYGLLVVTMALGPWPPSLGPPSSCPPILSRLPRRWNLLISLDPVLPSPLLFWGAESSVQSLPAPLPGP